MARNPSQPDELVIMGRVAAPYAVRGWIKVQPFTAATDSLLDYSIWQIGKQGAWQPYRVLEGKVHGQFLLIQLEGVNERNAAEALQGRDIAVARAERPPAGEGEYYWDDLIGLEVVNSLGESLGKITALLESGAHDIMKVQAGQLERLIPFTAPVVQDVSLDAGRIVVEWGLDW